MRICHVIESSRSSRIVLGLLADQLDAGHDVTLLYSPTRAEPQFTSGFRVFGERLRVASLPMQRAVGPHDVVAAWRLWRALRALGPFDIIHGHSSKAGALARLAGLFLTPAVVVYTPHAFITLAPGASPIYGVIEWAASWFCDAIVLGSHQEYAHARDALRLPASRLHLIRMGVDLSHAGDRKTARSALNLPDDVFVVGFVGRLASQKNPLRLARVFALVAQARPDVRFVVAGDGDLREDFLEALRASSLDGVAALTRNSDARDLMPAFDCLVCTSDYESFGLVFAEALAAGAPIVSPPVGAAAEAITTGVTGALTSFNPSDIAQAVLEIAAMPMEARAQMSEACRRQALLFDVASTARETRLLYERLLARKAFRRR